MREAQRNETCDERRRGEGTAQRAHLKHGPLQPGDAEAASDKFRVRLRKLGQVPTNVFLNVHRVDHRLRVVRGARIDLFGPTQGPKPNPAYLEEGAGIDGGHAQGPRTGGDVCLKRVR